MSSSCAICNNSMAEVRRLRVRVDALEWLREVEGLFRHFIDRKSYWRVRSAAFDELGKILIAAREAIR